MAMKRALLLFVVLAMASSSAQPPASVFDRHFTEKTMRVDYYHSGGLGQDRCGGDAQAERIASCDGFLLAFGKSGEAVVINQQEVGAEIQGLQLDAGTRPGRGVRPADGGEPRAEHPAGHRPDRWQSGRRHPGRLGTLPETGVQLLKGLEIGALEAEDRLLLVADREDRSRLVRARAFAGKPTVALVLKTLNHPFFVDMRRGAQEAADRLGVNLQVQAAEREIDVEKQMQIVENLIQTGIGALAITPSGSREIVSALVKARDARVPIIVVDTRVDAKAAADAGVTTETFVGSDNYDGGRIAGDYVVKTSGGRARVGILEGIPGHETGDSRLRADGFAPPEVSGHDLRMAMGRLAADGLGRFLVLAGEVARVEIGDVEEAVAADAEIDERGLDAGLQVYDPALVNVSHIVVLAGPL